MPKAVNIKWSTMAPCSTNAPSDRHFGGYEIAPVFKHDRSDLCKLSVHLSRPGLCIFHSSELILLLSSIKKVTSFQPAVKDFGNCLCFFFFLKKMEVRSQSWCTYRQKHSRWQCYFLFQNEETWIRGRLINAMQDESMWFYCFWL